MCGTTSDLSCMEEVSALVLCNLVPCIPDEGVKRLDWFGEHRDTEGGVGEASLTEVPCVEGMEDTSMCGDDGEDMDEESESSSSFMQESPCSTHHYSDRHHQPCSWDEQSKLGNGEDGSLGGLPASQDSEGEGRVKQGIHQPHHPPHCVSRSPTVSQWRQPQRF